MTVLALFSTVLALAVPAHRNSCHLHHACPSDHHTYKWNGWSCAARTADEFNAARDKKRIVYQGRVWWCRR